MKVFSDEFCNIHKATYIHMTPGKKLFAKRKGMEIACKKNNDNGNSL